MKIFILFINFIVMSNISFAQKQEQTSLNKDLETITLGAGCFWCVESIFQRIKGVVSVTSGYSGGTKKNPTYEEVCKSSDHTEVCQITFNSKIIKLDKLLEIFWMTHDPTTINKQGNDVGFQYRSVVFYHNETQKKVAEEVKNNLIKANVFSNPIVTTIEPLKNFYKAEENHQNYYNNNKNAPYCKHVIFPKLEKSKKYF